MPYYTHSAEQLPTDGQEWQNARDAHEAKQDGQTVTFVESEHEASAWRERETDRMNDGTYVRVPFDSAAWFSRESEKWPYNRVPRFPDHFVHVSLKNPGMLAYTKSAEHGVQDRQTIVKPGRYLQEYFSDVLTSDDIREVAATVTAETCDLKITRTEDEITTVYANGPSSCMDGRHFSAGQPDHPCRVYAGSDLALAYTGTLDKPTARAIVWPDKMIHSRVYGHDAMMIRLLESAGYAYGSVRGARVRAIEHSCSRRHHEMYLMPYVDGICQCDLQDDPEDENRQWFVLGDCGNYSTNNTDGTAGGGYTCDHCGDPCDEDGLCSYCEDNTTCCEDCGDRCNMEDMRSDGDSWYCDSCFCDRYFSCEHCNEATPVDEGHDTDSGRYCDSCYDESLVECNREDCGETFSPYDFTYTEKRDRRTRGVSECCRECGEKYFQCETCHEYDTLDEDDRCQCHTATEDGQNDGQDTNDGQDGQTAASTDTDTSTATATATEDTSTADDGLPFAALAATADEPHEYAIGTPLAAVFPEYDGPLTLRRRVRVLANGAIEVLD